LTLPNRIVKLLCWGERARDGPAFDLPSTIDFTVIVKT
jgi:hypothetical protein